MYSPEELKTLGIFLLAALLGRILFYRSLVLEGSFKQKVKVRLLQWLWELPVIMVVALVSFEIVTHFALQDHTGLVVAVAIGFIGVNTLKIWLEDWMESKIHRRCPNRRKEDDDT